MGKFNTVFWDGPQLPHQWGNFPNGTLFPLQLGNSVPFFKMVLNFPTDGEIQYRFSRRASNSPKTLKVGKLKTVDDNGVEFPPKFIWLRTSFTTSGEIEYRYLRRYSISPPWGNSVTIEKNGTQFPSCHGKLVLIQTFYTNRQEISCWFQKFCWS